MIKVEDVKDRKSLEQWLDEWPKSQGMSDDEARQVAVIIAHRAAMRVLPIALQECSSAEAQQFNVNCLPLFRCAVVSLGKSYGHAEFLAKFDGISKRAEKGAFDLISRAAGMQSSKARDAAINSISDASEQFSKASLYGAISEAVRAQKNIFEDGNLTWTLISRDLDGLKNVEVDDDVSPLWNDPVPGWFTTATENFRRNILREARDWDFWNYFLEQAISGKPMPLQMLLEIAEIGDEHWEQDAAHLAALINPIWERYKTQTYFDPVQAELDEARAVAKAADSRLIERVQQRVGENRKTLPPTLDALQELIAFEIERWQTSNELNATMPEECARQIGILLTMFEACAAIKVRIPLDQPPSKEDAQDIIGLGKLYKDKLLALPREKADEVVEGVYGTGVGAVQVGLVGLSAAALVSMGIPPVPATMVGAGVFARKNAADIVKAAKEAFSKGGD